MSKRMIRTVALLSLAIGASLSATGCAKNVDHVEFTKWGHSFVPRGTSMDTTAQGGAPLNNVTPSSTNYRVPKASVGGSYLRTFATSPSYRMVGGFHTTPSGP
jgi:hypothetical protein